jgi:hypothetical protein
MGEKNIVRQQHLHLPPHEMAQLSQWNLTMQRMLPHISCVRHQEMILAQPLWLGKTGMCDASSGGCRRALHPSPLRNVDNLARRGLPEVADSCRTFAFLCMAITRGPEHGI